MSTRSIDFSGQSSSFASPISETIEEALKQAAYFGDNATINKVLAGKNVEIACCDEGVRLSLNQNNWSTAMILMHYLHSSGHLSSQTHDLAMIFATEQNLKDRVMQLLEMDVIHCCSQAISKAISNGSEEILLILFAPGLLSEYDRAKAALSAAYQQRPNIVSLLLRGTPLMLQLPENGRTLMKALKENETKIVILQLSAYLDRNKPYFGPSG